MIRQGGKENDADEGGEDEDVEGGQYKIQGKTGGLILNLPP